MGKIIKFPDRQQPRLCSNCNINQAMPNYNVCLDCSLQALDILDDALTDYLMQIAMFADPQSIERVLINHIYDLQKGEYHKFLK